MTDDEDIYDDDEDIYDDDDDIRASFVHEQPEQHEKVLEFSQDKDETPNFIQQEYADHRRRGRSSPMLFGGQTHDRRRDNLHANLRYFLR